VIFFFAIHLVHICTRKFKFRIALKRVQNSNFNAYLILNKIMINSGNSRYVISLFAIERKSSIKCKQKIKKKKQTFIQINVHEILTILL
jgi:hypothetical protein